MKSLLAAAVLSLLSAPFAAAAPRTLTGKISDSMCGASHKAAIEHSGKKMTDAECVRACIKDGAKYVLVSQGKVYDIGNQDYSGLDEDAGKTVTVAGDVNGDTITISKMTAAKKM